MTERVKNFLFKNSSTQQTVAKNSFWLFFGHVISRVIRAILIIYAARVLGVEEWGVFSYAFSFATLLTIFMDFGITATVTRESVKDETVREKYFSTALVGKGMIFLIIAFGIGIISLTNIFEENVAILLPLVLIMLGFDGFRDFFAALSRIWDRMHIESGVQIITNVLIAGIGIGALLISATPLSLAWGYVIGTGIGMVIAFFPYRIYFTRVRELFSFQLLKNILKTSFSIGMVGLMWVILMNMDTVMVKWFGTIADVGYYGAIQRIWGFVFILPSVLAVAFFPSMTRFNTDKGMLKKLVERGLSISTLVAVPITVGSVILSWEIIDLLYGSSYIPAVEAFRILNFSYLPLFLMALFSNTLFSMNKEKKLLGYVFLGIGGNLLFNLLLIPTFGIEGAALSTVINFCIVALYLLTQLRKDLDFKVFHQIGKIIIATTMMALVLVGLRFMGMHIYLILVLGIVVYFAFLALLKEESLGVVMRKLLQKNKDSV